MLQPADESRIPDDPQLHKDRWPQVPYFHYERYLVLLGEIGRGHGRKESRRRANGDIRQLKVSPTDKGRGRKIRHMAQRFFYEPFVRSNIGPMTMNFNPVYVFMKIKPVLIAWIQTTCGMIWETGNNLHLMAVLQPLPRQIINTR